MHTKSTHLDLAMDNNTPPPQTSSATSMPPTSNPSSNHDSPSDAIVSIEQIPPEDSMHLPFRRDEGDDVSTAPSTIPSDHASAGAFSKQASRSFAPFMTKHIPKLYEPLAGYPRQFQDQPDDHNLSPPETPRTSNTKYCYRHRPDLKCRRQADEPSMDKLQKDLATLPDSDKEAITGVWSLFSAAPSKHRHLMLQGILAQCCFPQLSYISASVRDLIKIDFLSALPAEIGLKILCFLDHTSICKSAQVSRRWRTLADDDVVWHKMCEQHIDRKCTKCGWGLPTLDAVRLRSEKRQIQLRAEGNHSLDKTPRRELVQVRNDSPAVRQEESRKRKDTSTPEIALGPPLKRACTPSITGSADEVSTEKWPWKEVYRDRHRVGRNWKYGRSSKYSYRGHTNGVMCLQYDGIILASGSYDSTVKIWNMQTGEEIRTLTGHTLGVRCLQFDDKMLVSGSLDGTVRVWDHHHGKLLSTLRGHSGGVIGLSFQGNLVASASEDGTVRLWDFEKRTSTVLRGHEDSVNSVKIHTESRTIISTSDDCTIRLWDIDTKKCIKVFDGHKAQVQQVQYMPDDFDPGLPDKDEGSADDTDEVTLAYETEDAATRPLPPRYMVTGSLDSTIKLWDVHAGKITRTFFGHLEGIWGLAADSLRCVSGANDGLVKIWDPRTGICERTITDHTGPVTCVGLTDRRMCTGGEDHEILMYSFCVEGTEHY